MTESAEYAAFLPAARSHCTGLLLSCPQQGFRLPAKKSPRTKYIPRQPRDRINKAPSRVPFCLEKMTRSDRLECGRKLGIKEKTQLQPSAWWKERSVQISWDAGANFGQKKRAGARLSSRPLPGAADGGRTRTVSLPRDFKSRVSANFTTAADTSIQYDIVHHHCDKVKKCQGPALFTAQKRRWDKPISSFFISALSVQTDTKIIRTAWPAWSDARTCPLRS